MYRFLDHPSECLVEVQAGSAAEVFEQAARALFEIMTDNEAIKQTLEFRVELESPERNLLLIDWLNRLIFLHETENVFLSDFKIEVQQEESWKLNAEVRGEKIAERHERRSQPKSATYGQFEWIESDEGHRVRFVVDI